MVVFLSPHPKLRIFYSANYHNFIMITIRVNFLFWLPIWVWLTWRIQMQDPDTKGVILAVMIYILALNCWIPWGEVVEVNFQSKPCLDSKNIVNLISHRSSLKPEKTHRKTLKTSSTLLTFLPSLILNNTSRKCKTSVLENVFFPEKERGLHPDAHARAGTRVK